MIIHGVVDHAHNLLLLVGDRCAHFRSQIPGIGQVALVEELGRVICSAGCHQRRVRCKARPLLRLRARGQSPAQQAGPTYFCDRGHCGDANKGLALRRGHQLGPAVACSPCEQLTENAVAQTIHHQQQHGLHGCNWSHHAVQNLLNRYDSPGVRGSLRVPLHQGLGKRLGKNVAARDGGPATHGVGVRQLGQLIASQQPESGPVNECALVSLPFHRIGQRGTGGHRAEQPACQTSCHLDTFHAWPLVVHQRVLQRAIGLQLHLPEAGFVGLCRVRTQRQSEISESLIQR